MNKFLGYGLLYMGLLVVAGCEQQPSVKNLGLVYCVETTPRTLNPQLESSPSAIAVSSRHLYDRLVEVDPVTQRLQGGLAKEWQISEDNLTYRFKLRSAVQFHETEYFKPQRKLNADDVLFSFQRIIDTQHPYHQVSSSEYPFFSTINFAANIASLTAPDDMTVEFTLRRPDASFLASLASDYAVILSAEYAQQLLSANAPELLDIVPVGTGPFKYASQQEDHFVRYYRHWNHWRGAPPLQQLVFDFTHSSSGRLAKLLTGQCDIMAQPAATQIDVLKRREDLLLSTQTGSNVAYLAFNTQRAPFADVRIRRVVAKNIDKNKIIDSIYRDTAQPAKSVLSPSSWAHFYQGQSADFDQDMELDKLNRPLDLWVLNEARSFNPQPAKTAELIRNDLEKLGYRVNVRLLDWSVLRRELQQAQPDYDLLLTGWSTENSDPDDFFRQQFSCQAVENGYNYSRWCSGHFDELMDQATSANHIAHRIRYYYRLQALLAADVPVLPLNHAMKMYAYNDSISGITWNPYGGVSFNNAYRK